MNNLLKASLLTLGLALVYSAEANAALATHNSYSNSVNYCDAFAPGTANTLRNRVIGVENVGTAPLPVACNYASFFNGAPGNTRIQTVQVYFLNNNGTGTASVTCTLLSGNTAGIGAGTVYVSTKTTAAFAAGTQGGLSWTTADNPQQPATDLGNVLVGINCILPPNIVMSTHALGWTADNGVGT
jgi:hypothetical protein